VVQSRPMINLHPQLVHFPVALLFLYSIFELISTRHLVQKPYWFYIKAVLIIGGALTGVLAALSGLIASNFDLSIPLVAAHFRFAFATNVLFGVTALLYMLAWFASGRKQEVVWKLLSNRPTMILVSLVGLALITITAGLGGAMVYGTHFDPLMAPIFKLLGVY
jgi:uncharacterized membrane protein